ncbi:MAG: T9SS type A sorting domain-containing protein [Flavobacteriales bacterium]|nr:T9SS type A sorting domain-containing protein [Flavobacteriales bacterium]
MLTLLALPGAVKAQCDAGELEVTIQVLTDDYGNETMWQLVEAGAGCDGAPLFTGGNPALGCEDAGTFESPAGGYGNNATIDEGPFCLTEGASYDIICVDSYGDGQASFIVMVGGGFSNSFGAGGGLNTWTFVVQEPVARDMALVNSTTGFYAEAGVPVPVTGTVKNQGGEAVTAFTIAYAVDGGTEETAAFTVDLAPGEEYDFMHEAEWVPAAAGEQEMIIRIASVNGDTDLNTSNDATTVAMKVNPEIPDLIAEYASEAPFITVIADEDEDLLVPRDLDFHPDAARNELWVINKDVFSTGGSTVRLFDAGTPEQDYQWQRDPAARHFLSLPTGIAMGDNNNFATCPGVYDANGNQSTSTPFTGPTLWSADPAIYAGTGFGPLGSHLDMLHVTPRSQGIAHERWNRYWVVDGTNNDVVMHDFRGDHGPGQDYHGNAIIHRYTEVNITRDPNNHVVSHCVVDKRTKWLYIVDFGGQRVLRLDTRSGNIAAGNPSFGPFESYIEYKNKTGATWEVVIDQGLQQPAGIDVVGTHLLVSDHATGEIILYDMSADFAEIGRLPVGAGVMGVKVGPDGRIWCVNATTSELMRVDPAGEVGITERATTTFSAFPNPANALVHLRYGNDMAPHVTVEVRDAAGRVCKRTTVGQSAKGIDISALSEGVYTLSIDGAGSQRVVIAR